MISIKTGGLPPLNQKSDATIIGFEGFHLFIMKNDSISVLDVSQSSTLAKFVEKKQFDVAYKLACLGVPENDLKYLGSEALQNHNFDIAVKCFVKLRDLPLIELANHYLQEEKKGANLNPEVLKAELLAFQGKYEEAASLYFKNKKVKEIVEMYSRLKRF